MTPLLKEPSILSQGVYLQLVTKIKFLDEAIIRSNDPEEVLTFKYQSLGNRFVIPWRKIKAKLRRLVMEKQRSLNIEPGCHLKDDLCMKCSSCFIFGGTGETSSANVPYNILARILGESFISTSQVGEIQPYTQNAVDEEDLTTGQALMSITPVPKETEFIGVITLKDPTPEIASIIVDNLKRLTRIGARSVEWGRVETTILGFKLSDREALTAYNLIDSKIDGFGKIDDLKLPVVEEAYKTLDEQVKNLIKPLLKKKPEESKE
ncbi:MAG: type I-D CRISPR-associated protein Cas7/Csc2 [Acidobacteriota bacterium]